MHVDVTEVSSDSIKEVNREEKATTSMTTDEIDQKIDSAVRVGSQIKNRQRIEKCGKYTNNAYLLCSNANKIKQKMLPFCSVTPLG